MLRQTMNNPEWSDIEYHPGCYIRDTGCLIITLANALGVNAAILLNTLVQCGCFMYSNEKAGYLNKNKAQRIVGYNTEKVLITDINDDEQFMIYYNWSTAYPGHFSNVVKAYRNKVKIFNVKTHREEMVNRNRIYNIFRVTRNK